MRARTLLAALVVALAGSGCVYHQYTDAILFKKTSTPEFTPVGVEVVDGLYSNNPIFIAKNAKFSVEIDHIVTSWIHQHLSDSVPDLEPSSVRERGIARAAREHLLGRKLWLLVTITSLPPNDSLETSSNQYFKATSIKYNVASQSFLPLDLGEIEIFTHDADDSYRITFQLYDVKDIEFKKAMGELRNEPGFTDFVIGVGKTLGTAVGGLAGSAITRRWSEYAEEPLALERVLLRAGADEEFRGSITLYRKDDFESMYPGWLAREDEYVLADIFKSCPEQAQIGKKDDYETKLEAVEGLKLDEKGDLKNPLNDTCSKSRRTPRIGLRVLQSPSPTLSDAMSTTVLNLSQVNARLASVDELTYQQDKKLAHVFNSSRILIERLSMLEGCIPGEEKQPCQLIDWIRDAMLAHTSIEAAEKAIVELRGNKKDGEALARAAEMEITTRFERDRLNVLIGEVLKQLYNPNGTWGDKSGVQIVALPEFKAFDVDPAFVAEVRYQRQKLDKRRKSLSLLRRILSRTLD